MRWKPSAFSASLLLQSHKSQVLKEGKSALHQGALNPLLALSSGWTSGQGVAILLSLYRTAGPLLTILHHSEASLTCGGRHRFYACISVPRQPRPISRVGVCEHGCRVRPCIPLCVPIASTSTNAACMSLNLEPTEIKHGLEMCKRRRIQEETPPDHAVAKCCQGSAAQWTASRLIGRSTARGPTS